jgi:hypothetical protein
MAAWPRHFLLVPRPATAVQRPSLTPARQKRHRRDGWCSPARCDLTLMHRPSGASRASLQVVFEVQITSAAATGRPAEENLRLDVDWRNPVRSAACHAVRQSRSAIAGPQLFHERVPAVSRSRQEPVPCRLQRLTPRIHSRLWRHSTAGVSFQQPCRWAKFATRPPAMI